MQDLKRQVRAELSQSNFFEQKHTTHTAFCQATRSQVTLTDSWGNPKTNQAEFLGECSGQENQSQCWSTFGG